MAELVRGDGDQVHRVDVPIQRLVAHCETQAIGGWGFGIELDVVVQDRSGFVKARREFDSELILPPNKRRRLLVMRAREGSSLTGLWLVEKRPISKTANPSPGLSFPLN
jgi:hypothetical protein